MKPDPFWQSLPPDADLPPALRVLHGRTGRFSGQCHVTRGRGWVIALLLRLGRFPPAGGAVRVEIQIDRSAQEWIWDRSFNGHRTRSRLTYDHRRACVREDMGGLSLWLRPEFTDQCLSLRILRVVVFGVPCPSILLPRSATVEWQDDQGRFRFDVSAKLPGLGLLIRYRGHLIPVHAKTCAD
ncbi:DUF4166 domain-containing protein [Ruegeria sp.]|uniref:DUF4166 domain-containing protein n=1 Tax=Ruegeria sp. TaxID=1879320 RepID=UPI003B5A09B8